MLQCTSNLVLGEPGVAHRELRERRRPEHGPGCGTMRRTTAPERALGALTVAGEVRTFHAPADDVLALQNSEDLATRCKIRARATPAPRTPHHAGSR